MLAKKMSSKSGLLQQLFARSVFLVTFCSAAAQAETSPYQVLIQQGESAAKSGQWQSASELFFKACTIDDANALGFYDLGVAYLHLQKFAKARTAEERALDLNPNFVNAHVQMATILSNMGAQDEAGSELQKALAIEPGNELAKRNFEAIAQIEGMSRGEASKAISAITEPGGNSGASAKSGTLTEKGNVESQSAGAGASAPTKQAGNPSKNTGGRSAVGSGEPTSVGAPERAPAEQGKIAMVAPGSIVIPIGKGAGEFGTELVPAKPVAKAVVAPANTGLTPVERLDQATTAFSAGKLDLAKRLLGAAAQQDGKNSEVFASLGAVDGAQGDVEAEIAEERKAIALNKADAVAHMNLGWAYCHKDKWQDALKEYELAVKYDPHFLEARLGMGLCQAFADMPKTARATLEAAVKDYPKSALPHIALSMLNARLQNYPGSQAELQRAIDTDSDDLETLEHAGAQELYNENWDAAQEIFSRVIKDHPQDSQAWLGMGLSYEKTPFRQKALNCFRKAVELSPNDAVAHMALALAYEMRNRIPEAELELKEAIRLNPDYQVAATQAKQPTQNASK